MINQSRKTRPNLVATVVQMVALVVMLVAGTLKAAPARQQPKKVLQPDGQEITIVQRGDEWHHWVTDLEGRLRVKDAKGHYQIASESQVAEWKEMQELSQKQRQSYFETKKSRAALSAKTRAAADKEWSHNGQNHLSDMPSKGKLHEIVILVEFPDCQFSDSIDQNSYYKDFLMKKGFDDLNSYGSVHDYFYENSMGVFDPQFEVFGPVMMSQPLTYYGENNVAQNDKRPQEMIIEACQLIEDKVDFSKFDNNNDGYIDVVHVIYAGEGENSHTDHPEYIWPHAWSITASIHQNIYFNGKLLDDYVCTCETFAYQKDGIGTFCHEFSHALGLPDVYNSQGGATVGGEYDVMDSGLYLGDSEGGAAKEGRCPCAMNAYERYELGWMTPDLLIGNKYNGIVYSRKDTIPIDDHLSSIVTVYDTIPFFAQDTLPCLTSSNQALVLPVKSETNDPRDGEYFLFENRQMTGWDTYIPAHGMLVWHIDYQKSIWESNTVNTSHTTHPNIQLLRARPTSPFSGAPFPGGPRINNQLTATSTPALLGWDARGTGSGMNQPLNNAALTDIEEKTIKSWPTDEMVIIFSFTDDGPDHVTSIGQISADKTDAPAKSQPQRVWKNGQLQIITPAGCFDLLGRRIE